MQCNLCTTVQVNFAHFALHLLASSSILLILCSYLKVYSPQLQYVIEAHTHLHGIPPTLDTCTCTFICSVHTQLHMALVSASGNSVVCQQVQYVVCVVSINHMTSTSVAHRQSCSYMHSRNIVYDASSGMCIS